MMRYTVASTATASAPENPGVFILSACGCMVVSILVVPVISGWLAVSWILGAACAPAGFDSPGWQAGHCNPL